MTKQTDESIGIAFCDGGGSGGGDGDISIGGSGGSSYSGGGGGGGGGFIAGSGALGYIYPVPDTAYRPGDDYLPGAAYSGWRHWYIDDLRIEIARLRDENARLRKALKGGSDE